MKNFLCTPSNLIINSIHIKLTNTNNVNLDKSPQLFLILNILFFLSLPISLYIKPFIPPSEKSYPLCHNYRFRNEHVTQCKPRRDEKIFDGYFWERFFSSLCSDNMTNQPPIFLIQSEETCRLITLGCHSMTRKEPDLRWSQSVVTEQNVRLKNKILQTW